MRFEDEAKELVALIGDAANDQEAEQLTAKWLDNFCTEVWNSGWVEGRAEGAAYGYGRAP